MAASAVPRDGTALPSPVLRDPAEAAPRPARAPRRGVRRLNLALQGGGAHGAFTWGVLDRLLEEADLEIVGVSGASAGAMNATVMALASPSAAARARARRPPPSGAESRPRRAKAP
jgi:predicted acylesterase/phospholipase RssA